MSFKELGIDTKRRIWRTIMLFAFIGIVLICNHFFEWKDKSFVLRDPNVGFKLYALVGYNAYKYGERIFFLSSVWEDSNVLTISKLNRKLIGSKKINEWNDEPVGKNELIETYGRTVVGRSQRENCYDNIYRIKLAMEAYYKEHGTHVPLYVADENGNPLHSWRVLLLPYLGYNGLYQKIKLDESWDSEWNSRFHLVPDCYCCPAQRKIGFESPCDRSCYSAVIKKVENTDSSIEYMPITTKDKERIAIMERAPQYNWMDPLPEHELIESNVISEDYFSNDAFSNHVDRSVWVSFDLPFLVSPENKKEYTFYKSPQKFREELATTAQTL